MKRKKVALATAAHIPNGSKDTRVLMNTINQSGYVAEIEIWNDPHVNWRQYDTVFLHTAWDYILQADEFRRWICHLSPHVSFMNPTELILWNMDKRYLFELQRKGIDLPRTCLFDKGTELLSNEHNYPIVVKKVVSAGGRGNWLCHNKKDLNAIVQQENLYEQPVILQNYEPSITSKGEYSTIYLNGEYQFSILKLPRDGEFRVQSQYGGSEKLVEPDERIIDFSECVLDALSVKPKYARIDFIMDEKNTAKLMEVELIEPDLFLRYQPTAFQKFVDLL